VFWCGVVADVKLCGRTYPAVGARGVATCMTQYLAVINAPETEEGFVLEAR